MSRKSQKKVFLMFFIFIIVGLFWMTTFALSSIDPRLDNTVLTPTQSNTATPQLPPGPTDTPTATPVDVNYMPIILKPYLSPTPGPSPTPTVYITNTPAPPPT